MKRPKESGYTPCACRDCMETAISDDMRKPEMCHECQDAGCEHDSECQGEHSYCQEVDNEGNADPFRHLSPSELASMGHDGPHDD